MTCDTWHVTRDTWHVTCDMLWRVNIRSKFQLSNSYCLWFMILWRYGGKGSRTDWINEWIIDEAVYRTAAATPGLLKIRKRGNSMNKTIGPNLGLFDLYFGFFYDLCIFEPFLCNYLWWYFEGLNQKNHYFFLGGIFLSGRWTRTRPGKLVMPDPFGWLLSKNLDYFTPY